jgi:hypothetical protein
MRDSIVGENAVRALDPTRGQKGNCRYEPRSLHLSRLVPWSAGRDGACVTGRGIETSPQSPRGVCWRAPGVAVREPSRNREIRDSGNGSGPSPRKDKRVQQCNHRVERVLEKIPRVGARRSFLRRPRKDGLRVRPSNDGEYLNPFFFTAPAQRNSRANLRLSQRRPAALRRLSVSQAARVAPDVCVSGLDDPGLANRMQGRRPEHNAQTQRKIRSARRQRLRGTLK